MPQSSAELAKQFGGSPSSALAAQFGGKPAQPDAAPVTAEPSVPAFDPRSWFSKAVDTLTGRPGSGEVVTGMGKSVLGAVEGGGKLIRQAFPALDKLPSATLLVSTAATNQAQQMGKTVGDMALIAAPGGAVTKAKAALTTGRGVLDALVGAALEGGAAGAMTAAQTGDVSAGALAGGVAGSVAAGAKAAQPAAKWLGERIETALVKPIKADLDDGFKIGNVFKHGLGGTLRQTYDKTEERLTTLGRSLQSVLTSSKSKVDVLDALAETEQKLMAAAEHGRSGLSYPEIKKSLDTMLEKLLPMIQGAGGSPAVDLAKANQVKQVAGDIGAFTHGLSGKAQWGQDAGALEQAANTLYGVLKTRIEQQATGPVKAINQALGDVIGVRRAVIRRIPVAERQNLIGLTDALSVVKGGPSGIALSVANHVLRSGQVANALVKASDSAAVAPVAARTAGAVTGASQ